MNFVLITCDYSSRVTIREMYTLESRSLSGPSFDDVGKGKISTLLTPRLFQSVGLDSDLGNY